MNNQFDVLVIGAGSGGVRAARRCAEAGMRVAIFEGKYLGGTCVNAGCIPKKILHYSAEVSHMLHDGQYFGWSPKLAGGRYEHFNWQVLVANQKKQIQKLNKIYEKLLNQHNVIIIRGSAVLVDEKVVKVGETLYEGKAVVIATGSTPQQPNFVGKEYCLTSDDIFNLTELPKQLLVLGSGYIAVEFASILAALGVQVELAVRKDGILRAFDADIGQFLAEQLTHSGVAIRYQTTVSEIEKTAGRLHCKTTTGDVIETESVLYAAGRVANIDGLFSGQQPNLTPQGYIKVNEQFATAWPDVYALGDVIGYSGLTPVAIRQAEQWVAQRQGKVPPPLVYEHIPTAVFSHPQVSSVGFTEKQLKAEGRKATVYKAEFADLHQQMVSPTPNVFIKLLVDSNNDKLLGAHMIAPNASEIVQGVAVALQAGVTKSELDNTIGIHPTIAEEWVTLRTPSHFIQ